LKREDRRRREREFYEQLRKTLEQELQNMYPLAYAYVRWGESQRTSDGRLWPEVPSVQGRRIWWLMPDKRPGPILMPMINDRRFVIFDNEQGVFVDHNLFEFLVSDEQAELCVALMNSTIFALVREVISRVNLGEGATKTEGVDWNYNALLPNPSSIDSQKAKHIIRAYRSLQHRPVGAIAEEIRQKDRQALDRAVLEALGLDPEEYLPQIYQGLVRDGPGAAGPAGDAHHPQAAGPADEPEPDQRESAAGGPARGSEVHCGLPPHPSQTGDPGGSPHRSASAVEAFPQSVHLH